MKTAKQKAAVKATAKPARIARQEEETASTSFTLPVSIITEVRHEAADRRVWPARIVEERLRESYQRNPAAK